MTPKRCLPLLWLHLIFVSCYRLTLSSSENSSALQVHVGVILDLKTITGKMSQTSMNMAVEDFYAWRNSKARLQLHFRDSKSEVVDAASAAIDLLKNVPVHAILGPQSSTQADFIIDVGNRVRVPVVSPATSPSLSPKEAPFFTRVALRSSCQAKAISALVRAFGWRQVVFVYEDSHYGRGIVPFLTDAMLETSILIPYRCIISPSASDDVISRELKELMTMQTRVFVVHMLPSLAARLFLRAKEAGMMNAGYAWMITDIQTSLLDTLEPPAIEAMQGVLGVKPFIPHSNDLDHFSRRWKKRFSQEYPDLHSMEINMLGLWAYDSVTALATVVEKVTMNLPKFERPVNRENLTDLEKIGVSELGPLISKSIRNIRVKGLSGDFHILNGELQPSAFQLVNIIGRGSKGIGFWTEGNGISRTLYNLSSKTGYRVNKDDLGAIVWPGDTTVVPKGWEWPTNGRRLRIGVPVKGGLREFLEVTRDPQTKAVIATGFCIDVFEKVINSLPYAIPFDYIPFEASEGTTANYNDLVQQIVGDKYDAVVGDVTILANRSRFVDFTLPYTESGVATIVPIKKDGRQNAWIFMKPLTMGLWLTIGAFFIFTGFVVWVLEHRVNKEFRGLPHKQLGMIFWFSFSTLVFAHREKLTSNLARFVVIVWVFVMLVLTSSYTASLTSMLTVRQLQPTVTDIRDLLRNGEYVGYQQGSFVAELLRRKLNYSRFRNYSTWEEYDDALSKGSTNGGVAAIVDELPYLRLFLKRYCGKYTMLSSTYATAGFGFAFPKGSPLVADVSRAILEATEEDKIAEISRKWFRDEAHCPDQEGTAVTSDSLRVDSFKGLFLIAGVSSSTALLIFVTRFFRENREVLASHGSIWEKASAAARIFDQEKNKDDSIKATERSAEVVSPPRSPQSLAIISFYQSPEVFSPDEGLPSSAEPGSPFQDAVAVRETAREQ